MRLGFECDCYSRGTQAMIRLYIQLVYTRLLEEFLKQNPPFVMVKKFFTKKWLRKFE